MDLGRVSVVIPTRNRAALLSETLASVKFQSHSDLDIVVVDDAGTDETEAIVARHAGTDSRIRYIRLEENLGAPYARNLGIRETRGEFVQLLDSDDLVHRDKFRVQVEILKSARNADLAVCQTGMFRRVPGDNDFIWNKLEGDPLLRFLQHDLVWVTVAPLWRRVALEKFGGHDESLATSQDYEHHTRSLILGARAVLHRHLLAYYRVHSGPTIGSESVGIREETHLRVFKSFLKLLRSDRELFERFQEDLVKDLIWVSWRAFMTAKRSLQIEALEEAVAIETNAVRRKRIEDLLRSLTLFGTPPGVIEAKFVELDFDRPVREDWWAKYTLMDEPTEPIPNAGRYRRTPSEPRP